MGLIPLLLMASAVQQSSDKELENVLAMHVQSRLLLNPMQCNYRVRVYEDVDTIPLNERPREPRTEEYACRYWLSGKNQRLETSGNTSKLYRVWVAKDGNLKGLAMDRSGKRPPPLDELGMLTRDDDPLFRVYLPWNLGLFGVPGPNPPVPSSDFTREPRISRERIGSDLCIVVDYETTYTRTIFWFDIARNGLIRKRLLYNVKDPKGISWNEDYRHETIVEDFKEIGEGLYFPRRVHTVSHRKNVVIRSTVVDFDDVRIGSFPEGDLFSLRFRKGLDIADDIKRIRYRVGEGEQPDGPIRPAPPLEVIGDADTQLPTALRPRRSWWWYAVAAGIASLVLVSWLRSRMRVVSPKAE